MRLFRSCLVGLLCLFTQSKIRAFEPPKFELKDGDRIVLVGDTLIERDQRYGYLETLLVDCESRQEPGLPKPGLERRHRGGRLAVGL